MDRRANRASKPQNPRGAAETVGFSAANWIQMREMAATQSHMLALGTPAPAFALPDVSTGEVRRLSDLTEGRALLVVFLCAHCPYVVHVAPALARLAEDYAERPVSIVGITSNDVSAYPQDGPEPTARFALEAGFGFPILFDEEQSAALAYSAACTPDFFLFDAGHRLFYRGQIDSSRPGRGPDRPEQGARDGADLRAALEAVLGGRPAPEHQRPSIGCSIKWKPGNAPSLHR